MERKNNHLIRFSLIIICALLMNCTNESTKNKSIHSFADIDENSEAVTMSKNDNYSDSVKVHFAIWRNILMSEKKTQDWFGRAFIRYIDSVPASSIYFSLSMPTCSVYDQQHNITSFYVFPYDSVFGEICSDSTIDAEDCKLLFTKHWNENSAWAINIFLFSHLGISAFQLSSYQPDNIAAWKTEQMKEDSAFWNDHFR